MSTLTDLVGPDYRWDRAAENLWEATLETLYTSSIGFVVMLGLGLVIGVVLYITSPLGVSPNRWLHRPLSALVNIVRAVPFVILAVAIIPLTDALVGTYLGPTAAIVPIVVSSVPFVARLVETALLNVGQGKIEAAQAVGATRWQIIAKVLLPESVPGLIALSTFAGVAVVSNSAMVGAVGGGGLGSLALTYGYQRFDYVIMTATVVLLVVMVQLLQSFGDLLVARVSRAQSSE